MSKTDVGCELQRYSQSKLSGSLHFNPYDPHLKAIVYLRDGAIYAVQFNDFRGKRAFQHILRLINPDIIQHLQTCPHQEITEPLDELLVEAMQAEILGTEMPEPISLLPLPKDLLNPDCPEIFILSDGTTEWVLETGRYLVGRGLDCHISINQANVSGHHCILEITNHAITVHELKSRNGTYINDGEVEHSAEFSIGDTLTVAETSLFMRKGLRARYGKRVIAAVPIELHIPEDKTAALQTLSNEADEAKPEGANQPIRYVQTEVKKKGWGLFGLTGTED